MFTWGSVDIVVFNPVPVELFNLPLLNNPGTFTGLQLQYVVPIGHAYPARRWCAGHIERGVQFSGTSQYPHFLCRQLTELVGTVGSEHLRPLQPRDHQCLGD